jgi:aldose 1-epimerase
MYQTVLPFGTLQDGRKTKLYLIGNDAGMTVGVSDLGADLILLRAPDGHGKFPDVLLGYDGCTGYETNGPDFGAIIGRCANRIAGASFELYGSLHHLSANEGRNSLHSGPHMYFQRIWEHVQDTSSDLVCFKLHSSSGDQGFPGTLDIVVSYRLTENNALEISYEALPSEPTIINLTCHAYWNLNGHASGSVLGHSLKINAQNYTPADEENIPTGEICNVKGTPFDFVSPRTFESGLGSSYDHNFLLDSTEKSCIHHAAHLTGDISSIALDVFTDAPAMQLYTSGFLNETMGKDGAHYGKGAGVALETQFPPDAIHHRNFPQPIFTPERPFRSKTIFAISHI